MSLPRALFITASLTCLLTSPAMAQAAATSPVATPPVAAPVIDNAPVTHAEFEALLEKTLMAHPEIIMQAAEKFQTKQAEEQQKQANVALQQHKDELLNDSKSPHAGNPKGDVTIVEFFDYHCGYCKHLMPDIVKLVNEDKNIRVLFREFPILSPDSITASHAALAVNAIDPAKYFEFHQELMKSNGRFDEKTLMEMVKKLGINGTKFKAEMDSKDIDDMIDRNRALAESMGITGTPALIIGDTLYPGALPYDEIKKAVADARSGKKPAGGAKP